MKKEKTCTCIFCEKPTEEKDIVGFGDESSCKKCHTEIFDELNGSGKEATVDLPENVNDESELYDYIEYNYEWFEEQIGETATAWLILKIENGKAKIKFI